MNQPILDAETRIARADIQDLADLASSASAPPDPRQAEVLPDGGGVDDVTDWASYYWDATTMAPLNTTSAAALERLRAYKPPPFPLWDRLPVSRRAAVLLLLFADRRGDLRVVVTMRAARLRTFSGHAAFPGGKADSVEETPYQIARREAWEEIGLPQDDSKLPAPFRIEHLCDLPHNLARTELAVRPCVAYLHSGTDAASPTAGEALIPRLDAKEVAAVFSAPFHNFLLAEDELLGEEGNERRLLPEGKWYEGEWMEIHRKPWRAHYFYVPVNDQRIAKPKVRDGGQAAISEHAGEEEEAAAAEAEAALAANDSGRYKVWGMTARIIMDAATVAFAEKPQFEHNDHFGDELLIEGLDKMGRLTEKRRPDSYITAKDIADAKDASSKM